MKKKWLILIGVLLLFSLTFANKSAGRSVDSPDDTIEKVLIEKVKK